MKRKITFDRDGLALVGNLFTPDDFDENGQYPAVIVEGSFTSVKEQMAGTYAERFADAEGRLPATFEILFLCGWAPHPSQPKPLRRGSATKRLADALRPPQR